MDVQHLLNAVVQSCNIIDRVDLLTKFKGKRLELRQNQALKRLAAPKNLTLSFSLGFSLCDSFGQTSGFAALEQPIFPRLTKCRTHRFHLLTPLVTLLAGDCQLLELFRFMPRATPESP